MRVWFSDGCWVVIAVITIKVAFFFRNVSFLSQTRCRSVPETVMVTESVCQECVTVSLVSMEWTARKVRDTPITPRSLLYGEREKESFTAGKQLKLH